MSPFPFMTHSFENLDVARHMTIRIKPDPKMRPCRYNRGLFVKESGVFDKW